MTMGNVSRFASRRATIVIKAARSLRHGTKCCFACFSKIKDDEFGKTLMPRPIGILRTVWEFVLNSLTAIIGTAVIGAEFSSLFHTHTLEGVFRKEVLLSVVIAFLLGYLAFYKLTSATAKWVWIVGAVGFVCRIFIAPDVPIFATPLVVAIDYGRSFNLTPWMFVSVRAVSYSLGAISCQVLRASASQKAASERAKNPL